MKKWFVHLKSKWDIKSNFQLFLIFVVFALTGSFSLKLAEPVLYYFGFSREIFYNFFIGDIIYWFLRLLIIFPIYQLLLLFFWLYIFSVFFFLGIRKKNFDKNWFRKTLFWLKKK